MSKYDQLNIIKPKPIMDVLKPHEPTYAEEAAEWTGDPAVREMARQAREARRDAMADSAEARRQAERTFGKRHDRQS